jgi:hypothetical protein
VVNSQSKTGRLTSADCCVSHTCEVVEVRKASPARSALIGAAELRTTLAGLSRFCEPQPVNRPGCPRGPREVGIRRDRVTETGDETRNCHWVRSRKGAGSRAIRMPGDLPGRSSH